LSLAKDVRRRWINDCAGRDVVEGMGWHNGGEDEVGALEEDNGGGDKSTTSTYEGCD